MTHIRARLARRNILGWDKSSDINVISMIKGKGTR